jgi:hypothetical protein
VHESKRYLGLDLVVEKNQKTALAVLEYYPTENKIFLLDIFERIAGDQALLEIVEELKPGISCLGTNVPLDLPPCIPCTRKTCPTPVKCTDPQVKWMRDLTRKIQKSQDFKDSGMKVLEFTPYTQRPIELWIRYQLLPKLPESHRFEVDEALGGNKAPLTARMSFLKRHLHKIPLAEVWPKLAVAIFAQQLGLQKRTVAKYRQLEEGIHAREEIIEELTHRHGIFIYERDVRKLSHSLAAFDAFICAYTALLSDTDRCAEMPHGFPSSTGWVQYPILERSER